MVIGGTLYTLFELVTGNYLDPATVDVVGIVIRVVAGVIAVPGLFDVVVNKIPARLNGK